MKDRRFLGKGLPYLSIDDLRGKLVVIEGTDGVGRSTQMAMLQEWIELQGHAVVTTGWTRSNLLSGSIDAVKRGNMLNHLTYTLLYATDFADRLENVVVPALRSDFVVLSDRYIYTAIVRSAVRGMPADYLQELFSIALEPDLVIYLEIDLETLVPRVIESGGLDYWESGMDMRLDGGLYESFVKYQGLVLQEFSRMASAGGFHVVDARRDVDEIQADLRRLIAPVLGC